MKSIKIENGDIVITSKRLELVEDTQQKIQKTKGILLTSKGELFYNTTIGLERSEILEIKEKNISKSRNRIAIMEALMQDENVEKVEIIDINNNKANRNKIINLKLKYKEEETITDLGGIEIV
ncbi:DUF2634 domain-containing protein [Clostridium rectalis]|uniref:contractile injection system sheath initiator n=1 Tax=Clostridium rectalis TaxID=2040295 RepID=UPI000F63BE66|nr:DUF2634 domain-containing protein [Clostridium rectalis]